MMNSIINSDVNYFTFSTSNPMNIKLFLYTEVYTAKSIQCIYRLPANVGIRMIVHYYCTIIFFCIIISLPKNQILLYVFITLEYMSINRSDSKQKDIKTLEHLIHKYISL
jgi:hypothetical protein